MTRFKQYERPLSDWWHVAKMVGDGYDAMDIAKQNGWHVIPSWGPEGRDLGSWPLVWVAVRNHRASFEVAQYVEGDGYEWRVPTLELRDELLADLQRQWNHDHYYSKSAADWLCRTCGDVVTDACTA